MRVGRYHGLVGIVLLLLVESDLAAAAVGDETVRPNILLLVAEDMSARVGAFGDPVAVTPNLDRLAEEGTRYEETFVAAAVCAPSRAALLTGMHPISIGAQHMRTSTRPEGGYRAVPPAEVKAFPELMRAKGYYTFTDSKLDYQFSGPLAGSGPSTIWDAEGRGQDWTGREDADQPFFGLINFQQTHESGVFTQLCEGWPHSFMHLLMQLIRAFALDGPSGGGLVAPEDVDLPPYYPDTSTVRSDLARHYGNIGAMDVQVGEILAKLEADGLADSTIVIWTTDHGDGLPRAKRDLYDSGMHVPMVIRWPARWRPASAPPGGYDERLISFVDLAPTVLELADASIPDSMHGRSFWPTQTKIRDYVFASRDRIDEFEDRERAVRDTRYKYIRSWKPDLPNGHRLAFRDNLEMMRELWELEASGELDPLQQLWFEPTGEERLYDTDEDPFELHNLVDDPTHAETLSRMRAAYAAWQERVSDWSDQEESVMVARMWPGGDAPVTAEPIFSLSGSLVEISSATQGASISYRIGEGPWRLYRGPLALSPGKTLAARAVRYGFIESEEVEFSSP